MDCCLLDLFLSFILTDKHFSIMKNNVYPHQDLFDDSCSGSRRKRQTSMSSSVATTGDISLNLSRRMYTDLGESHGRLSKRRKQTLVESMTILSPRSNSDFDGLAATRAMTTATTSLNWSNDSKQQEQDGYMHQMRILARFKNNAQESQEVSPAYYQWPATMYWYICVHAMLQS